LTGPARPEIADNEPAQRFEARLDGELAGTLEYVVKRGRLALVHTEVLPDYEGRGVGSALARFGLDEARRRHLRVIATCPFVRSYVERHPETHDIVVGMPHRP
jgi:predicted GNAT family acetyltransferase